MGSNQGMNQLAGILQQRSRAVSETPSVVDVGTIQSDWSLLTNKFPIAIPKNDYLLCRSLVMGKSNEVLTRSQEGGQGNAGKHSHNFTVGIHGGHDGGDGSHSHSDVDTSMEHVHDILVGEKLRSLQVGDRVLVVWVDHTNPCVVDILYSGSVLTET